LPNDTLIHSSRARDSKAAEELLQHSSLCYGLHHKGWLILRIQSTLLEAYCTNVQLCRGRQLGSHHLPRKETKKKQETKKKKKEEKRRSNKEEKKKEMKKKRKRETKRKSGNPGQALHHVRSLFAGWVVQLGLDPRKSWLQYVCEPGRRGRNFSTSHVFRFHFHFLADLISKLNLFLFSFFFISFFLSSL